MEYLFDTNSTNNSRVVYVTNPIEIVAFGLLAGDTVSVEIALTGDIPNSTQINGCSFVVNPNLSAPIQSTVPYVVCGSAVRATQSNPRFLITRPGFYVVKLNGASLGDAVVVVNQAQQAVIDQFANCSGGGGIVSLAVSTDGLITATNADGSTVSAQIPAC